ncbi:MAG: SLC13 family permease [Woeseia sp.]
MVAGLIGLRSRMEPVITTTVAVSYWPMFVLIVSMAFVVVGIAVLKIHPFFVLILAAVLVGMLSSQLPDAGYANHLIRAVELSMSELGSVAGSIAFVILLAAVIGMCMLESGAADRIVRRAIAVLGESRAPLALLAAGFFLSIPVFFDTVFFLLLPIARALALRTGRNYVLYILAICAGAVVTHVLVAPTPGPLLVAEILRPVGVELGTSMLAGILAGIPPAVAMLYLARRIDARKPIDLRETPGISLNELEDAAARPDSELPPFLLSVLPVVVPVLLISASSIVDAGAANAPATGGPSGTFPAELTYYVNFLGNKNVAMLIGTAIAVYILARQKKMGLQSVTEAVGPTIATGGVIVLTTAAGGAFGAMIRHSGVGDVIRVIAEDYRINYVLLSWLVAAVIRLAQGSATVAMITSAGLMTAIVADGSALPVHPIYIFLAIGFGSTFCSWMNDSGFWVVGKLAGFTERETLQTWTVLTIFISVFGLIQLLLVSRLLPFR